MKITNDTTGDIQIAGKAWGSIRRAGAPVSWCVIHPGESVEVTRVPVTLPAGITVSTPKRAKRPKSEPEA